MGECGGGQGQFRWDIEAMVRNWIFTSWQPLHLADTARTPPQTLLAPDCLAGHADSTVLKTLALVLYTSSFSSFRFQFKCHLRKAILPKLSIPPALSLVSIIAPDHFFMGTEHIFQLYIHCFFTIQFTKLNSTREGRCFTY